jgi:hypothetical protein
MKWPEKCRRPTARNFSTGSTGQVSEFSYVFPVEEWTEQIVLPVEAIAREGAESFVFQQNGKHFDRVPVHVRYRDSSHAVIASDGSLVSG